MNATGSSSTWDRVPPHQSVLHSDLAQKMDPVTILFEQWQQDVALVRRKAQRTRAFPDIDAALLVYHRRGERGVENYTEMSNLRRQEYYYVNRRQSSGRRMLGNVCDRCYCTLERHCTVYANVYKGEVLCLPCITTVMRSGLGEDDQRILEEAHRLSRAGWAPSMAGIGG